jgi:beta-mannanase
MFIFKTSNIRFINKPIFITEFGVKGPEEYKATWLEDAARILNKNPQVVGVNYFNMSDTPGAWGEIKEPDWSITSETLHRFLEVLAWDDL